MHCTSIPNNINDSNCSSNILCHVSSACADKQETNKKVKAGIWHVWCDDDNEHDDYDVDDVMVIMMIYKVTNTVASSNWYVWNDEKIELMVI